MSSDFLAVAQSRQEQLAAALGETLGEDIAVSVSPTGESFTIPDCLSDSFAAKATGDGFEFVILVKEATLETIGEPDVPGGPASTLQSIASNVAATMADKAAGDVNIEISSPGEFDGTALADFIFVSLTADSGTNSYEISVALAPTTELSADAPGIALPDFGTATTQTTNIVAGLGMLADVEVDVTVELGRRRLPINELLNLTRGSIIELDKLVGEPLEVYVNNRLIADGEAVVIDEQFGIRITNIIASAQRALTG